VKRCTLITAVCSLLVEIKFDIDMIRVLMHNKWMDGYDRKEQGVKQGLCGGEPLPSTLPTASGFTEPSKKIEFSSKKSRVLWIFIVKNYLWPENGTRGLNRPLWGLKM